MLDIFDGIRDRAADLWDSVTSHMPYGIGDKVAYAVPIVAAGAAAVSMIVSLQTNATASSVEGQAMKYQQGQHQLAAVLGEGETVGLGEESEAVMGRADLILQYKDLAALSGENVFTQMEKMANVSESAEEKAAAEADSAVYDSIYAYAGSFGGALIRDPGQGGTVKLAAYEDEAEMEAPDDSSVSNVLVKQIRRTIKAETYGERDTKNTLTILSGNDISGFTRIQEGSYMFLLLGRSNGTKTSDMYVCTRIEPGTIDDGDVVGDTKDIDDTEGSENAENETNGTEVIGLSAALSCKGSGRNARLLSLSTTSNVASRNSDGSVTYSDGTRVEADGTVIYSDGTSVAPDGTVTYPDGMTVSPDGSISGASKNGGSSNDSGNSSQAGSASGSSSNGSSEDGADRDGSSENTQEAEADAEIPEVYTAGGIRVEDNKDSDVILYSINTRTGSVTVTYWQAASVS